MSALLLSLLSSSLLVSLSEGSQGRCLPGTEQKQTPGAEHQLTECQQYSESACCSPDHVNTPRLTPFPWDLCAPLSPGCERFARRVQCMYLCSPHISAWGHADSATGIRDLPLCHGFCDHWFDACKEDLICTGDSPSNCTQACDTYTQVSVQHTLLSHHREASLTLLYL
ncbi:riboflavin-binding protein-like isoform X2 [Ascaphus truei]